MKNTKMRRPVMEEYVDYSSNQTSNKQPPTKNIPSHYEKNNIESKSDQNNSKPNNLKNIPQKPVTNTEELTYEEENVSKTSQAHKTKEKDYKINPIMIPRPNHYDEIYRNSEHHHIYDTNEEIHPPHSATFYNVREVQNSSCRYIRSSLTKIPTDQSVLNNSSLLFGLYVQPFAEIEENEMEIPKVENNDQIFRCRRCNSYINSKYEITYNKSNRHVAICNICFCENDLDSSKPSVKNEYLNSTVNTVTELSVPTIDFIAPSNMKHTVPFSPHYIFIIDISQMSYEIQFANYLLNSIISNADYIHNANNSFVAIATFDHKSVHFFAIEKNSEVKAYIMSDMENPFCPLPRNKIFLNAIDQKSELEKVVEKVTFFINEKYREGNVKKTIPGSVSGSAIAAGISALEEIGGRVMVFTCNACINGLGACKPKEENKLYGTPNEKSLYIPQHAQFNKLIELCIEKRTVVDQFIFGNNQFDLATFSPISNLTGGTVNYYSCYPKDIFDMKIKFEKLHYDLSRILTRPNYYDVKFMLRYSIGIDNFEVFGPFNKKLGDAFQLASCNPDYSFCYNLRLSESLKNNQRYHFQLVCLYIDNFNQRYLRVFNYTVIATNDISKIYSSADVDTLSKITLLKEISLIHQIEVNTIKENLFNKIVNAFYYYRTQCSKNTPVAQLILPASIKYYPLYMNSFIKKNLIMKNKMNIPLNSLINLINKWSREPLYLTMKSLYPKFYRIDDIQKEQIRKFSKDIDPDYIIKDVGMVNEKINIITKPFLLPLSLDHVDFYCAYLSDDGEFISLFIFNYINTQFYQELFGVDTFEEAVNLNVDTLDENNTSDLNVRILNIINQLRKENKGNVQPLKIFFIEDVNYAKPELLSVLIEDKTREETNYVDFLCRMHEEIQKKMNS